MSCGCLEIEGFADIGPSFDKYVVPLLDKPMDLRRLNELDTSKPVRVEQDDQLWENVKKHQSQ